MPYTRSRIFDDVAKLVTDAAGAAQGARRDVETMARSQIERLMRELDVPTREELEAVKSMARLAREENERLKERLDRLEGGAATAVSPGLSPDWTDPAAPAPRATKAKRAAPDPSRLDEPIDDLSKGP